VSRRGDLGGCGRSVRPWHPQIRHLDRRAGTVVTQRHCDAPSASMLAHVRQCLLDRPQQHDLGVRLQPPRLAGHLQRDRHAPLPAEPFDQPTDGFLQRRRLQVHRGERLDHRARLDEVLPHRVPGECQMPPGGRRVRAHLGLCRLQQHLHGGQPLGEGVADLPGQPLTLGEHPRVVADSGELGPGLLQLPDHLGALGALVHDPADPHPQRERDHQRHAGRQRGLLRSGVERERRRDAASNRSQACGSAPVAAAVT
jgi:hypothetical protein